MRASISGDFRFIAWSPPTMLIGGGILMLIFGAIMKATNIFNSPGINSTAGVLMLVGWVLICFGIIFYGKEREWW